MPIVGQNEGHRGHRKVKCELDQALVIITLWAYIKFNVHSSNVKQVIVLEVADRRTNAPHDDNRHATKLA